MKYCGGLLLLTLQAVVAPLFANTTFQQAQKLFVSGETKAAISLVSRAIEAEKSKPLRADLIQKLEMLGTQMISEKNQQEFESAVNNLSADLKSGLSRLIDLSRREPHQLDIHIEIVRAQMKNEDCKSAKDWADKNLTVFKSVSRVELLQSQLNICLGLREKALDQLSHQLASKSELTFAIHSVFAEIYCLEKQYRKCADSAEVAIKARGDFPESHYWLYLARKEQGLSANELGQKYITLCKVLSSRQKKDFQVEPFLCKRTSEVDASLKKGSE